MNKNSKGLLPFPTIQLATEGNIDAINAVLEHYEGYISVLSTKQFYDENGNSYLFVDEEMRRRLETKLIIKILAFKVGVITVRLGACPFSCSHGYHSVKAHRPMVSFYRPVRLTCEH